MSQTEHPSQGTDEEPPAYPMADYKAMDVAKKETMRLRNGMDVWVRDPFSRTPLRQATAVSDPRFIRAKQGIFIDVLFPGEPEVKTVSTYLVNQR